MTRLELGGISSRTHESGVLYPAVCWPPKPMCSSSRNSFCLFLASGPSHTIPTSAAFQPQGCAGTHILTSSYYGMVAPTLRAEAVMPYIVLSSDSHQTSPNPPSSKNTHFRTQKKSKQRRARSNTGISRLSFINHIDIRKPAIH